MIGGIDWARELAHSWPLLGVDVSTQIATAPLPVEVGDDRIRVGVDGADARHLLVPVGAEEVRASDDEGAVTVRLRTYTFQGSPRRYVDVVCARPDLHDVFDGVLVDILGKIVGTTNPASGTVQAVARWRALLATRRIGRLTVAEQMSLVAELTVLDTVTAGSVLRAGFWRGPLRQPHDIVTPDRAIEVKAVGPGSGSVTIHGLAQLEPPGRPLALVMAEVTEDETGRSLPDVVEAVLARVDDSGEMQYLLTAAGYDPSDVERYAERFTVDGIRYVEISDEFPRIVPSSFVAGDVPRGVSGLSYRLALDVLAELSTGGETSLRSWVRSG